MGIQKKINKKGDDIRPFFISDVPCPTFQKKVVEAHKFCDNTYIESAFKRALSWDNWVRFTWDLWRLAKRERSASGRNTKHKGI